MVSNPATLVHGTRHVPLDKRTVIYHDERGKDTIVTTKSERYPQLPVTQICRNGYTNKVMEDERKTLEAMTSTQPLGVLDSVYQGHP